MRVESGRTYTLQVGYQKRPPSHRLSLSFNISLIDETAEASSDYFVNPTSVQFLFDAGEPESVTITFNQDDMVEMDETFLARLDSTSAVALPTGPGVFFNHLIRLTIVDGDGTRTS